MNGPEVLKFAAEDEWVRLDRVVSKDEILAKDGLTGGRPGMREYRYMMMAERIMGN